jgi:hypothetical protein
MWSGPGAATLLFVIGIFLAMAPVLPHDCTWARSLMALCGSAPLVRYLAGGWARTARRAGGRTRGADQGRGPCEPSRRAAAGSEEEGRHDAGRPGSRRRPYAGRADPDALPASGRPRRIVAPDGSEIGPTSKPQPDGTLVKALARAWRWQRMLNAGIYATVSEIGDAEKISKSYVSRMLRRALLQRPLPARWEEQRDQLC